MALSVGNLLLSIGVGFDGEPAPGTVPPPYERGPSPPAGGDGGGLGWPRQPADGDGHGVGWP